MEKFNPAPGQPEDLGDGITRILAPNPSPMTFRGTNTYLLGERDVAVIDPGPDDDAHLAAILRAVGPKARISHILVTHSHLDHSPLARKLARETGAEVFAFGPSRSGRSPLMEQLARSGLRDGGEGIDPDFAPDRQLKDGACLAGSDWEIEALWTPGHLGNHLCFCSGDVVFTGDLVMGWASSLVSPPDGDLSDFMASCRRLRDVGAKTFHAGHGAPINNPPERLDALIAHRETRGAAIVEALGDGPATAAELARRIYSDTPENLLPAAVRNVLAHLIDLYGKNRAVPLGALSAETQFALR
ncbi:MBL fold metallo-hydrolase [Roseovarius aestuariivivens]|uniref:MBL fold metallo-hydrolase n=1 Tax=Roseovarius aestuariivivens TaxID=1888910 RepID=UPI0010807CB8|nr:MBL fold metallo-hydrolase [Roseovarius aestuariivivens]